MDSSDFDRLANLIVSAVGMTNCTEIYELLLPSLNIVEGRAPPNDWKFRAEWGAAHNMCNKRALLPGLPAEQRLAVALWACVYH